MPRIPLPEGFEGEDRSPHTHRSLTNCFNNGDGVIVSRPGIEALNTTGKIARGCFVWNDCLYQVVTNDLIKISNTETGAYSTNGTGILGSANIVTAIGFNHAVILVPGGAIYSLSKTDVLTRIDGNSNFVPCNSVAHINGRFVYIPSDGDPAFFSDVGAAGTVGGTSFFDAEELPDKNKVVFEIANTLCIGGTDSIELFRDNGQSPNPFGRVSGARIPNGVIGGLLDYGTTFLFFGRKKKQGHGIFKVGNGDAPKISNSRIDKILKSYTESDMAEAVAQRFIWNGYDVATFTLGRHSFGFFNGNWFVMDTIVGGISSPWHGGFIAQFEGEYFTAHEGNIGKLAQINSDYGTTITKEIAAGFEQEDKDYFACQTMGIDISQGYIQGVITGPDIVLNGAFPTDLTSWSDDSAVGGAIAWASPGKMAITNTTGIARATQQWTNNVIGDKIKFDFDISDVTGNQRCYFTDPLGGIVNIRLVNGRGTYTATLRNAAITISFRNFETGTTFHVDNVTATKLTVPDRTVGISMSKDNVLFGPMVYRSLGLSGEYDKHLEWNESGGLGTFDGFMGFKIRTTQDVDFGIDTAYASFR